MCLCVYIAFLFPGPEEPQREAPSSGNATSYCLRFPCTSLLQELPVLWCPAGPKALHSQSH